MPHYFHRSSDRQTPRAFGWFTVSIVITTVITTIIAIVIITTIIIIVIIIYIFSIDDNLLLMISESIKSGGEGDSPASKRRRLSVSGHEVTIKMIFLINIMMVIMMVWN